MCVHILIEDTPAWSAPANVSKSREPDVNAAVDIAAFARKMTWDPARGGISIGRTEEFPAEYVFPGKEVVADCDRLLTVPVWKGDQACIGLEWLERRDVKRIEIQFHDSRRVPEIDELKVEFWHVPSGHESMWQGKWLPLDVTVSKPAPNKLVFEVHFEIQKDEPRRIAWKEFKPVPGFMKVRFIFPAADEPVKVKNISAYSSSSWQTMELLLEQEKSVDKPEAEIEIYNGKILSHVNDDSQIKCRWDMNGKLEMKISCSRRQQHKSDRTILWFRLPETAFGVAVEDLIDNGCVYVPHAGVFLTDASKPINLLDYRERIEGRQTALERVHEMPDQSMSGAMEVFNDIQNYSPTFMALVCHNRKFNVRRSGTINYSTLDYLNRGNMPKDFLVPQFGAHKDEDSARLLEAESFNRRLAYPQRPSRKQIERDRDKVRRRLRGDWMPIQVLNVEEGGLIYNQYAFVAPWNDCPKPFQPGWADQKAVCVSAFIIENLQAEPADAKLTLNFVSFQDKRKDASRIKAGIRVMDLMNRGRYARQCLDYYLSLYNEAGALTTGYTLMGTGWNLWTVAEHFRLTRDREWFRKNAPDLAKACEWIVKQCDKTKARDAYGNKVPEYGLFPPGVTGDWSRFGYRFYLQAHNHNGLSRISELLTEFDYPGAERLTGEAAEFRQNILRAYRWSQQRNPALAMPDGTWVPPYPAVVYSYGRVSDMHPSGNRAAESYDVEHGSQHLDAAFDLLDPHSDEVNWMVNHLEDVCFLFDNRTPCHEGEDNRRRWFDKGGFSKYQPAHSRIVRIHGLRDDVKAVIRSNFNEIPGGFDSENLSAWEHPCATAAWNKTHTTGRMVAQSRQMLVMEKGDQLWLAPFVPSHYMMDGQEVSVKNAPTHFGKTNYTLTSSVRQGYIEAVIDPPVRNAPAEIFIRIRHPDGKMMRSVFVNDRPHTDFNGQKEYVRLKPSETSLKMRVEFERP